MAVKKETYSQAMERLEKIVRQIDNNELDIDILSEKIKEANEIKPLPDIWPTPPTIPPSLRP